MTATTTTPDPTAPIPPPGDAVAWALDVLGPGVAVSGWTSMSQSGGPGPWRITTTTGAGRGRDVVLSVRPSGDPRELGRLATEDAALETCGRYDIPAPRLLGVDHDGSRAGVPALLATAVRGSSRVPPSASVQRLRDMGRIAGAIHQASVDPSVALPVRVSSLEDMGFESMDLPPASAAILAEGRAALTEREPPSSPFGFVHGDLWQGNTLWDGDTCLAAIDWDFAGVGPAGIDLGSMRLDAVLFFGADAVGEVAAGWQEQVGTPAPDLAWWDLVSAMATPPDLDYWLPNLQGQGRIDLTKDLVTQRRDTFLADILTRLDTE